MSLTAGALGIDYSGARPDPNDIVQNGGRFVLRYSAGVGNGQADTQWKLCGPNEIHAATAAGLDVIANCEWYAARITEGAAAGKADGTADLAFWRSRGLNEGASIYVSADLLVPRLKYASVAAYLKAYDLALGGLYRVDCYAGTPLLNYLRGKKIIQYGWRPNAGSWSNDGLPYQPDTKPLGGNAALLVQARKATPAHIWQTGNYWYGKQADENLIIRTPVGSHLEHAVVSPPPPPPPPTPGVSTGDPVVDMALAVMWGVDHGKYSNATHPNLVRGDGKGVDDRLRALEKKAGLA